MPLYEYYCPDCKGTFETLRSALEADTPAPCPTCRQVSSQRILSLFARSVKTDGAALAPVPAMAGGCGCGGACSCH
jgi:putative FmdB family regulatory protein